MSTTSSDRIPSGLQRRVMPAEDAAGLIPAGANVGMSGFTSAGYPKALPAHSPTASAPRGPRAIRSASASGRAPPPPRNSTARWRPWTASICCFRTSPIRSAAKKSTQARWTTSTCTCRTSRRWSPRASSARWISPSSRRWASPETVSSSRPPRSGNNKTWIDQASNVIVEVNARQSGELDGMHDIYYGTALPPTRTPIPLTAPGDRIGVPHLLCPASKIVAIVETDTPDHTTSFTPPDAMIPADRRPCHRLPRKRVAHGRLPRNLLPLQAGVGNIANAVLDGLRREPVRAAHGLHRGPAGRHARAAGDRAAHGRLGDCP